MAGTFEAVAKVAIEEIITTHAKGSKFGFILTAESLRDVCDDLYSLLETSRTMKAAGDRMLSGATETPARDRPAPRRPNRGGPGRFE